MVRSQLEHSLRNTDLVIEVGGAFQNGKVRLQNLRDQFLCCGFADAPGDSDHGTGKGIAHVAGDIAERMERIDDLDMRQVCFPERLSDCRAVGILHKKRDGTICGGLCEIVMPIKVFAAQGNE